MKLAVALAVVALSATGCSDSGGERDSASTTTGRPASSTTTLWLAPGYHLTDCSKIRAGDTLDSKSLDLLCDPANAATIETLDCVDGVYVLLRRSGDALEGFLEGNLAGPLSRTTWQKAGEEDPEAGHKTPFAQQACKEV